MLHRTNMGSKQHGRVQYRRSWDGNDEMSEVNGDGFAELQPDGFLHDEICLWQGDEYAFIA